MTDPTPATLTVLPAPLTRRRVRLGVTLATGALLLTGSVPALLGGGSGSNSPGSTGSRLSLPRSSVRTRHTAKPTPSPTATVVSSPAPSPSPSASLAPAPTSSPALAAGTGYHVPSSIPADCSRPVEKDLMAWFATVPDNSTILFTPSGCYGYDNDIVLNDRTGLTLDGQGATFKALTLGYASRRSWRMQGGSGLVLRNMIVRGSSTCAGISDCAWPAKPNNLEWQHAFSFEGTVNSTLDNVQAYDVWGDFVEVQHDERIPADAPNWATPARNISVLNSHFDRNGRMGVGLTNVDGFLLQDSYLGEVNMAAIDLELDFDGETGRNIRIVGNTFGRMRFALFANHGSGSSSISNIVIDHNTMVGDLVTCRPPVDEMAPTGLYRSGFTITNNTLKAYGDAFDLQGVRNATVSGNVVSHNPAGGCGTLAGVAVVDSQVVSVTDNRFVSASVAVKQQNSTQVSASGNSLS